ncbi:T9SS type A sorting domain-containing protein [candidate division TA06 bacterium]|uniref:T9SS type A sorting domain-containing protein n=1 Tax=candidate division TA06 bacterium TaxID=2250710 RepID=A0A523URP5_UNCT6|nr:MAG: T9SS type A sorting domain-containing protein [candidate division TA06 bacterium]
MRTQASVAKVWRAFKALPFDRLNVRRNRDEAKMRTFSLLVGRMQQEVIQMRWMFVVIVLLAVPFMSFAQDDAGQPYPCEEDLIEVMFAWDSEVRLRSGALADLTTNALVGVDEVLQKLAWFEWYRIADVPEEQLDEIQFRGEANTGKPVYNLNNIYRLRIPKALDVWAISKDLEALDGIMLARPVPKPTPPPLPPDYEPQQGYLDPASSTPTGIDAEYAWTQPGGDGTGVTVCDLEYSWKYNHTDIPKALNSQINSNVFDPFSDDNHGTAVIGELVSDTSGSWGTTGICYGASLKTCGTNYGSPTPTWNVPGAMTVAIANLTAGDVILLEQQWDYTGSWGFVPIEWWLNYSPSPQSYNGVYAAIVNAVSNGIHVVEAGGNGNIDTDLLTWYGNSGAIIVGAGGAYTGGFYPEGDLERLSFSSYGSRFDLQGWGEDVVTTGYGDLYSAEGDTLWYTNSFSGTSSASPIVAGAVACCVGYWTANISSTPPSPAYVRTLLTNTGTPQIFPPSGSIGPRPDLAAAFAAMPPPSLTVTNTNDTGTGSLRWAITQANTRPGLDTIDFNITGPGPHTIQPPTPLPSITDMSGVLIDGYTEQGSQPNTQPRGSPTDAILMIQIDGSNTSLANGFHIPSNNNTLRGLVINRFYNGVVIDGGMNNHVTGCYIGTDSMGYSEFGDVNQTGVWVRNGAASNVIGGPNLDDRNLISGWDFGQVDIVGLGSDNNTVEGNYIGTEKDGMAAIGGVGTTGNGVSIFEDLGASPMYSVVTDNVISGNPWMGIEIAGPGPGFNTVVNNYIGLDATGAGALGNGWHGVYLLDNTQNNTIGPDNIIAFNDSAGVCVFHEPTDFNTITQNSIYDNGELGIDLADDSVTTNDPGDLDMGPNQELNFPVITAAFYNPSSGTASVAGAIDIDTNPAQAIVEVFLADPDPTSYGEGRVYLGSATPDGAGNWNAVVTGVSAGEWLTATTTDVNGNTSEFSATIAVVAVGVEETSDIGLPKTFPLTQNHPNPFNSITDIKYGLPNDSYVKLDIFNVSGQKVATLVDEKQSPGYKAVRWNASSFAAGVYFYRLDTGDYTATQKMILMR